MCELVSCDEQRVSEESRLSAVVEFEFEFEFEFELIH